MAKDLVRMLQVEALKKVVEVEVSGTKTAKTVNTEAENTKKA